MNRFIFWHKITFYSAFYDAISQIISNARVIAHTLSRHVINNYRFKNEYSGYAMRCFTTSCKALIAVLPIPPNSECCNKYHKTWNWWAVSSCLDTRSHPSNIVMFFCGLVIRHHLLYHPSPRSAVSYRRNFAMTQSFSSQLDSVWLCENLNSSWILNMSVGYEPVNKISPEKYDTYYIYWLLFLYLVLFAYVLCLWWIEYIHIFQLLKHVPIIEFISEFELSGL